MEEVFVPSFKNYDFYFDGAYSAWKGSGASLHLNTVPGAARLSVSWFLRVSGDTVRETYLLNYSRYLGLLDLGLNMALRRNGSGAITPGAGGSLSSYSKALRMGVGVSYLSHLPMGDGEPKRVSSFGIYLFSHDPYHRGGEGYNVALGYSKEQDGGSVEGYVSYKWRGINPFLTLRAPFGEFPFLLKAGLRLTIMRFRVQSSTLIARGGAVGYVISVGAELPR